MTPEEITRGIASLKAMCDPRGHELLDAIGSMLVTQAMGAELLESHLDLLHGQDIVAGRATLPRIGRPNVLDDNTRWSRKAPNLEIVS